MCGGKIPQYLLLQFPLTSFACFPSFQMSPVSFNNRLLASKLLPKQALKILIHLSASMYRHNDQLLLSTDALQISRQLAQAVSAGTFFLIIWERVISPTLQPTHRTPVTFLGCFSYHEQQVATMLPALCSKSL